MSIHYIEYKSDGGVVAQHPDGTFQAVCGGRPEADQAKTEFELVDCEPCRRIVGQRNSENDRCCLSDEGSGDYAPVRVDPDGSIICGCSGCVQMRLDGYGCNHAVSVECSCVEEALYGPAEALQDDLDAIY